MNQTEAARDRDSAQAIYDVTYANCYETFYLHPWPAKHEMNRRFLDALLPPIARRQRRWLDLCCGQAWHFSRYPDTQHRLGVDLSAAQLQVARQRNPQAQFLCADVLEVNLPPASFDLVTCFWGAYCYLDDIQRIETLLRRVREWTAPGGAVYLELLAPEVLASFNASDFARHTGFQVEPRSSDYTRWGYADAGGHHLMTSPTREWFVDRLAPYFNDLQLYADGGFMGHLVATGLR